MGADHIHLLCPVDSKSKIAVTGGRNHTARVILNLRPSQRETYRLSRHKCNLLKQPEGRGGGRRNEELGKKGRSSEEIKVHPNRAPKFWYSHPAETQVHTGVEGPHGPLLLQVSALPWGSPLTLMWVLQDSLD